MAEEHPYEYIQVSFKRFKSEKPDGSGKLLILEHKSMRASAGDTSKKGMKTRELFRNVKKGISSV